MPKHSIPYRGTGYFSSLIVDYIDESENIKPFYHRFPETGNFKSQFNEKSASFPWKNREVLVKVLKEQYASITGPMAVERNLSLLSNKNTFTVTTGHQLNLFTGPLYFLYKIISTINLCKQLKESNPDADFVPVYWMATEDHDFEEINFFNFKGKKVVWERDSEGPVGRLSTEGLEEVFEKFSGELGGSANAQYIKQLFENAYLKHSNLADATRFFANELFGPYGLVIIDGDENRLKKIFIPYLKDELKNKTSSSAIDKTNTELASQPGKDYTIQVNPREINLFYIRDKLRERIVDANGGYRVLNTDIYWTSEEAMKEIETHPERFSPNVMLRPLYQEVVLPNICYIGGGGEIAYWLQLKSFFSESGIPFPILLLRNSVLLMNQKQEEKRKKLGLSMEDLFLPVDELKSKYTRQISEVDIDFSKQREALKKQFKELYLLAERTDKSFIGAVAAQEKKQLNGLDHLEKRLLKAQKRKLADLLERVEALREELFPNGSLQERTENFSEWYLEYGEELMPSLIKELQPLDLNFLVLEV